MKKETILILLLGAGALFFISAKKKPKGRVFVPEPEKITREQFEKPALLNKVAPVVKKLSEVIKKQKETAYKKKAAAAFAKKFGQKKVGNFPDIC